MNNFIHTHNVSQSSKMSSCRTLLYNVLYNETTAIHVVRNKNVRQTNKHKYDFVKQIIHYLQDKWTKNKGDNCSLLELISTLSNHLISKDFSRLYTDRRMTTDSPALSSRRSKLSTCHSTPALMCLIALSTWAKNRHTILIWCT